MEFENEEEIALLLAKHFDMPDPKHFDFSKIIVKNKDELMKVLRKRRSRLYDSQKQTGVKKLAPNGKAPAKPTRPTVLSRRGRPRHQPALPQVPQVQQVSTRTMMVNTDLLTLGSVVPGCDPRVEPPGLVMSKGKTRA